MIHVQPTPEQRRPFAVWAVAQTPKWWTVSPNTFAVPAGLYAAIPEELLIGSLVDGHRYVSPDEVAQTGATELLGVATAEGLEVREGGTAGGWLPEAPAEVHDPDSVALSAPTDDDSDSFPCGGCDRSFTSERGRDTHRRQKHAEA